MLITQIREVKPEQRRLENYTGWSHWTLQIPGGHREVVVSLQARMPAGTPCTVTADRLKEPGSKLSEK